MSWENNVRRVTPYVPGEQPKRKDIIKLNTNENPYPPAPAVQKVLREFSVDTLRKYPDPTVGALTKALSENYCVPEDQIFVGVGSDDVLAMSFMTFFHGDKPILFPDITYSFYDVWAQLYRIPYEQIPLNEDFTITPSDYFRPNGGVVIANPNAPTGVELPLSDIEEVVKRNPDVVVIVDEAYVDFGGQSALPLIDKYDNLMVVQTFSKSRSMAGMRIGFAFGCPKLIKYLQDVKFSFNSYTMNIPTLTLGALAMADREYFDKTRQMVTTTRERVSKKLRELGFEFADSSTNFVFARHPDKSGKEIFDELRKRGIIVRRWDSPRIKEYMRISIGTDEEMDALVAALKEII
jgi:histidinol-phosphate aminotransferase